MSGPSPVGVLPHAQVSQAEVGVIGGSGFYHLFGAEATERIHVTTPYGEPSDVLTVGAVAGRTVAFLPRHGSDHTIPPHRINYRANLWALDSIGVTRVVAPCAVGSLRAELAPGDVVVCDQFVDATKGKRDDTFFDGPEVAHLSAPRPYCSVLRAAAAAASRDAGLTAHDAGTVVVIEGPRFSTEAESRRYLRMGGDVLNMTQYPEVVLARELGICYTALGLVTDYDAGLDDGEVSAVTQEDVLRVFAAKISLLRQAVLQLVAALPDERLCDCAGGRPEPIKH